MKKGKQDYEGTNKER